MKRNPDFLLKNVAGKQVLVPVGKAAAAFPGMITVNETGKYIWSLLENDHSLEDITKAIVERYEIDAATAEQDAKIFIERLCSVKAIVE